MRVCILAFVALLAVEVQDAEAQRNCKKGIPCGNTCISATKTCRIGSQPAQPTKAEESAAVARLFGTPEPPPIPPTFGPYVGSIDGNIYYSINCRTAWKLSEDERVYFPSEENAQIRGYRRSRAKGC